MASVSLTDVLGAPQLCGVIQGVKTGVPDVFPAGFYQVDKTVERDVGSYFRVTGTRTNAKAVAYGSPSAARQMKGVEEVPVKLVHSAENISFPMADFRGLIRKDSSGSSLVIDEKGVQEVGRQVREARKNIDNLKVSMLTSALFQGAIYFDGQGNLLPSSSGARTTTSMQIPSGNTGQLNVFGGGAILTAGWQTAGTDIATQALNLKQAAVRKTGYPLKYAFYGKNVPGYLTNNTKLQNFFVRNAAQNSQFLTTAEIPNPLLGFTWLPAYEAFFEDASGNIQSLVGDDQVVFTPEPSTDWLAWLNGTYDVPTALKVGGDAVDAIGNTMAVGGDFAYAVLKDDPVSIKMVYGTTTLPVVKVPGAIYIATVNF